jgi:hypothetical protein
LESALQKIGKRLAADWKALGSRLESAWQQIGKRLAADWRALGSGLESPWQQIGKRLPGDRKALARRLAIGLQMACQSIPDQVADRLLSALMLNEMVYVLRGKI